MAGRRVYNASNMVVILQNEGISQEEIEALLVSGAPGLHDVGGSAAESSFFRQVDLDQETGIDDSDEFHQPEKKRRLSADQVQFLERSFEMENKLEPERKVQLARELGLQPRQVAVWFQNRRARWKTKQLERDYEALKTCYGSLKADHEKLIREKEDLKAEVTALTEKLLLREKVSKDRATALEPKDPTLQQPAQKPEGPDAPPGANDPSVPAEGCRQEDVGSAHSAVVDGESPRCSDDGVRRPAFGPAGSPNAFDQQDCSDLSHGEDEEEMYGLPRLEDGSCHYGSTFPAEEPPFWLWPSY